MNFKIVEQDTINYEQAKQDYIKGLRHNNFCEKHGIGKSQYLRLLKRFQEDGVPVNMKRTPIHKKKHYNPTNVYRFLSKGIGYWRVSKIINGKTHYFGTYKSKAKAEKKARELKDNNWEEIE